VDNRQDQSTLGLALLRRAERALAEAHSIEDVKAIRDQAEAVRTYFRSARLGLEIRNYAAELKLRAERRAGRLLSQCKLRGGDRRSKSHDVTRKLSDWGVTRRQSSCWQLEASVSDADFERYVSRCRELNRELTCAGLVRLAKSDLNGDERDSRGEAESDLRGKTASLRELCDRGQRFACIWASPLWSGNRLASPDRLRPACSADLRKLAVRDIAAEQPHLHLVAPAEFLCDAIRVIDAWGFAYRSVLVLEPLPQGFGSYWRPAHQFLLLGVRGRLPFRDNSLAGQLEVEGCRLAICLEALRGLIERVSPGPYLELFGHEPTPGWTVVGETVYGAQSARV
jgi:N6-adenosine-specific RNA methylase IME4